MDRLSSQLHPSDVTRIMAQAGMQQAGAPSPPKVPTHDERIAHLEEALQRIRVDLENLAESHAAQLTQLQNKVG